MTATAELQLYDFELQVRCYCNYLNTDIGSIMLFLTNVYLLIFHCVCVTIGSFHVSSTNGSSSTISEFNENCRKCSAYVSNEVRKISGWYLL